MKVNAGPDAYLDHTFEQINGVCAELRLARWLDTSRAHVPPAWFRDRRHESWLRALANLPAAARTEADYGATVRFAAIPPLLGPAREALRQGLMSLRPWRKGPFEICGEHIDAEWRSNLKWSRVRPHVAALHGRRVLDVGCGNGYYLWRMREAGAGFVLGIDPQPLAVMQFRAISSYADDSTVAVLPLPSAALDRQLGVFDTVFSMGVLYHRRDADVHLRELRRALIDGGELVLETLIVAEPPALVPVGRYARMRNVWWVPDPGSVLELLAANGFADARCVDITVTTTVEQRTTPWMPFESLEACLDPSDPTRTVEGLPAPLRAVFVARAA